MSNKCYLKNVNNGFITLFLSDGERVRMGEGLGKIIPALTLELSEVVADCADQIVQTITDVAETITDVIEDTEIFSNEIIKTAVDLIEGGEEEKARIEDIISDVLADPVSIDCSKQ